MASLSPVNIPQVPTDAVEAAPVIEADERELPTLADLDALVAELDELDRRLAEVDD